VGSTKSVFTFLCFELFVSTFEMCFLLCKQKSIFKNVNSSEIFEVQKTQMPV
jgi:hypothetical protein